MVEILSTVKPEVTKKPEIKIEYNNRSYESYVKNGFADSIPQLIKSPYEGMHKFFNQVDLRKGPIERTVRMIVRLKAPDWSTKKAERKEYVYYEEYWDAKNWLGIPITKGRPDGHIEGKYTEVMTRPVLDEKTGEHIDNAFAGTRQVYYIPFSKSTVDDIIKNSVYTDKSNIRFVVKFAAEDSTEAMNATTMATRNQFPYEIFVWPWDKLYEYHTWPVDDLPNRPKAPAFKTAAATNKLEFKPS